jgi:hypothetical protein
VTLRLLARGHVAGRRVDRRGVVVEAGHRCRWVGIGLERHARDACTNHSGSVLAPSSGEKARRELLSGSETPRRGALMREGT